MAAVTTEPAEDDLLTPETCSDQSMSGTFETLAPFNCNDVYAATSDALELISDGGPEPTQTGLFIEAFTICTTSTESTYSRESVQIPALADSLMGVMCDADRSLIVAAEPAVEDVPEDPAPIQESNIDPELDLEAYGAWPEVSQEELNSATSLNDLSAALTLANWPHRDIDEMANNVCRIMVEVDDQAEFNEVKAVLISDMNIDGVADDPDWFVTYILRTSTRTYCPERLSTVEAFS